MASNLLGDPPFVPKRSLPLDFYFQFGLLKVLLIFPFGVQLGCWMSFLTELGFVCWLDGTPLRIDMEPQNHWVVEEYCLLRVNSRGPC